LAKVDGIKKVSDFSWEIPQSYKPGMNVPARIYATTKLLDAMDSGVIEQVTNVACLPGIVRYSYAMADAHWGYGFPIGGVAAFEAEKGVISPGGVGFDVNCLHPDSRLLDQHGAWHRISKFDIAKHGLSSLDLRDRRVVSTKALLFLSRREESSLLRVRTELGRQILVTDDHPVLTQRGMVLARDLTQTDRLVTTGFEGVEYEPHQEGVVLDEVALGNAAAAMGIGEIGGARARVIARLRKVGLASITWGSSKLPLLLKLMGSNLGSGTIRQEKSGAHVAFYGQESDLARIKEDLGSLGFEASMQRRGRRRRAMPHRRTPRSDDECSLESSSKDLAVLLVGLGAPVGKKSAVSFRVPDWVIHSSNWQKRLFLSAYFGAELDEPRATDGRDIDAPSLRVSKRADLGNSAFEFLGDIREMLFSLGVESAEPVEDGAQGGEGYQGRTAAFRLSIEGSQANLKSLFSTVGYSYSARKERLASLASQYIDYLASARAERRTAHWAALRVHEAGQKTAAMVSVLQSADAAEASHRALTRAAGSPALAEAQDFHQFVESREFGSGLVLTPIMAIDRVPYVGPVYDLSLDHKDHNFIADGVVVSNCGMRLIRTNLRYSEVKPKVKELVDLIFDLVPAGVGVKGSQRFGQSQMGDITSLGVKWCAENGLAWEDDPAHVEEGGYIKGADISKVSGQAVSRGVSQFGTLGSGNHYLEIQVVDPARFLDRELAPKFGIVHDDQVMVMIHCGSRGFGHQICTDYLRNFESGMRRYGIQVRDRDLACLPFSSKDGQDYYSAMVCAANFAFVNRQIIVNRVREAFSKVFHRDAEALDMHLIYDVCHNVAKVERHTFDGRTADLLVHRKGATRSFGPGHKDVPAPYRDIGQPVIIGGSMETGSYLLVGTKKAMEDTFGSTAHGSGRTMSRTAAKREVRGAELQRKMLERGIYVKAATMDGLAEEAGMAYKDISEVVETMDRAGISKKVAALRPVGNIKG
jgi:tRNA-splicing ligase RtcB (3'-phosphate/5'-hydroxy nucleic acid ligase)